MHERYRQTDRRQTTDARAIAYSEREREFTFAKNEYVWRGNRTDAVRLCAAAKLTEKNKLLKVEGHVPQCPIAGDAIQFSCCSAKLSTSVLLNYGQNN